MSQGRCMNYRHHARQAYARQEAYLIAHPERAEQEPFPMSYEGVLMMADCESVTRKPEPTQAERRSIAASKKPRERKTYGPSEYARSVPSEKRGTRSTQGVTIIHSGKNRSERRADAAYARHTAYVPRTTTVARLGNRAIARRQAREEQQVNMARQSWAAAQERKLRVAATAQRNARMAAVVAGIETDTATWK